MKITNAQIYSLALSLQNFNSIMTEMPIKLNFYIQKNRSIILPLAQEIETMKIEIISKYGDIDEQTGQYTIFQNNIDIAQKEIQELFSLEQEVNLYKIKLSDFPENFSISVDEMEKLMILIEE